MKLSFLSLCFSALILLASCTKEAVPPPTGSNTNDGTASLVHVTASEWSSASSMTWTDATATQDVFLHANWNVAELTQQVLDNGAVLVYAKTTSDDVKMLPALFEQSDNSSSDIYRSVAAPQLIHLSHAKYKDGAYETPSATGDISFRFILIDNIQPANGYIATYNGVKYSMDELKLMNYNDVATILGIAE